MRGVILLNGDPPRGKIETREKDYVVCCDGAYRWAKEKVGHIDLIAGDFDSLGYVPERGAAYPSEKNYTDGEIALRRLLFSGADEIDIYGGGGGREDHLWGNIQLLYAACKRGARAVMHTKTCEIFCARGRIRFSGRKGKTFTLAPVGALAHIIDSSGVKYPLENLTLRAGSTRGVSNVFLSDEAEVHCDRGALFVFIVESGKE